MPRLYWCPVLACKRKDESAIHTDHTSAPKKPRLVFTDLQRRTLQAIFKVNHFVKLQYVMYERGGV